jgi:hypothetical protein
MKNSEKIGWALVGLSYLAGAADFYDFWLHRHQSNLFSGLFVTVCGIVSTVIWIEIRKTR